jgi:hypothetical protein
MTLVERGVVSWYLGNRLGEMIVHEAQILEIVRTAIMNANINHPQGPSGFTREQIYIAAKKTVCIWRWALETAEFVIVPRT